VSFLLVTQAILCRFICESEILESKIFFFVAIFGECATKYQGVTSFAALLIRMDRVWQKFATASF
jgi:hypothetical protein